MHPAIFRSAFWLGFFAIVLWAWWVMFSMSVAPMPMMPNKFVGLFSMWAIMMAAMMGPTFVPTMRAYEDLITSANGSRLGSIGVILGFFFVWIGFAALIAIAQTWLIEAGLLSSMAKSASTTFSAGLLISAGAYQFTALKDRCLAHCRSPMFQFLAHWRPGFLGGIRMGLHHGAYCVACCWGLMVIGFVGGIMDLLWMGGATILMTLEKLPQLGKWLTRPLGIGLILWGVGVVTF
jgi:predicted metal-binding membrane protein